MNQPTRQTDQERVATDPATLVRSAADDELTPTQRRELDAYLAAHPEARRGIQFERRLREAIRRSMGDVYAPWPLRQRIIGLLRHGGGTERAASGRRRLVGPAVSRAMVALAAVVVLSLALGVMVGPASPWLRDTISRLTGAPAISKPWYRDQLTYHLVREHRNCDIAAYVERKLTYTGADNLAPAFRNILGRDVTLGDVESLGFRFVASGRCNVPGRGTSVHLLFERTGQPGLPDARLSLFVKQDRGEFTIPEGRTFLLNHDEDPNIRPVLVWRTGGLVYLLVTDCPVFTPDQFAHAMDLPEPGAGRL